MRHGKVTLTLFYYIIRAVYRRQYGEVMAMTTATREDRIELRATKEEKRLLATAASYERLDVTSFIMRNVLPSARKVVDRAERIVLSERDTERVFTSANSRCSTALCSTGRMLDTFAACTRRLFRSTAVFSPPAVPLLPIIVSLSQCPPRERLVAPAERLEILTRLGMSAFFAFGLRCTN